MALTFELCCACSTFVSSYSQLGFQFAMHGCFFQMCKYMIPFMLKISGLITIPDLTTIYSQYFLLMYGFTGIEVTKNSDI